MPARKIVLLLVALMIAGTTVIVARSMMSAPPQSSTQVQSQPDKPMKEILVATKDLPSGTLLKAEDMKWEPWPAIEGMEASYFIKGLKKEGELIGSVVRYGMQTGEPLVQGRIVKPGQHGFMATVLSPGMRAVSISITPVAGVAGFVFPGDHVDVIVTHKIERQGQVESSSSRKVSETVLYNVRVLALDQEMGDQGNKPKVAQTATLEVSSKQAETVALATELGTLSLALRSIANDPQESIASETTAAPVGTPQAGEADVSDLAVDATALALPEAVKLSDPTWDSDVSRVLPRPSNRMGAVQKITIIRGKDSSEAVYDLTTPQGTK